MVSMVTRIRTIVRYNRLPSPTPPPHIVVSTCCYVIRVLLLFMATPHNNKDSTKLMVHVLLVHPLDELEKLHCPIVISRPFLSFKHNYVYVVNRKCRV